MSYHKASLLHEKKIVECVNQRQCKAGDMCGSVAEDEVEEHNLPGDGHGTKTR